MNSISIIRPISLLPGFLGKFKGSLMTAFLSIVIPFWIIITIILAFIIQSFSDLLIDFVIFLIGVVCAYFIFWGGKYKPEKSFFFFRLTKEKMRKIYIYTGAVTFLLVLVTVYFKGFHLSDVYYFVIIPLVLYYTNKSLSMHEDVDCVTNMEVSELLGMEVDEKIQASYQNFNSSDIIKSGSNMMMVTDKKVIFAVNNGTNWELVNKKLCDIVNVGHVQYNYDSYLKLVFSDNTTIGLRMGMLDKITSNPSLFFRKFLIVLDAVLLGKTDEKIASRRRVSVNNEPKPSVSINNEGIDVRTIDLSETILNNLRDATPIESGRILEF